MRCDALRCDCDVRHHPDHPSVAHGSTCACPFAIQQASEATPYVVPLAKLVHKGAGRAEGS
eukprot:1659064-Lingulodinium_polyedra.AAC.1